MKFLLMVGLVIGGVYYYSENSTWSKERKNQEIARAMKEDFKSVIREAKSHPAIKDATIKHDKKGCGIVMYVKMNPIPGVSTSEMMQMGGQMKSVMMYAIQHSKDKDTKALRYIIRKGIYLMYRIYTSNGKLIASFKVKAKDLLDDIE